MQSVSHIANMKLLHLTLYVHFDLTAQCLHNVWIELRLSIVHLFISERIIMQSLYCFCLKECHFPEDSKRVYSKAYSVSSWARSQEIHHKGVLGQLMLPMHASVFFPSSRAVHAQTRHVSPLNLARSPPHLLVWFLNLQQVNNGKLERLEKLL